MEASVQQIHSIICNAVIIASEKLENNVQEFLSQFQSSHYSQTLFCGCALVMPTYLQTAAEELEAAIAWLVAENTAADLQRPPVDFYNRYHVSYSLLLLICILRLRLR